MVELKANYHEIIDYLRAGMPQDPIYDWILEETPKRNVPELHITDTQGRFLRLLTRLLKAERILEVGTLAGYSTVWMASALPENGRIISLEASEQHAALAREAFERAGYADRIEVLVGPALETMERLELDAPLDMVFIDADKPNNINYFDWCLPHVRPGGLVLIDNVLLDGHVVRDRDSDYMQILRDFNRYVFENYADQVSVIPFYKKEEDNLDAIMVVEV